MLDVRARSQFGMLESGLLRSCEESILMAGPRRLLETLSLYGTLLQVYTFWGIQQCPVYCKTAEKHLRKMSTEYSEEMKWGTNQSWWLLEMYTPSRVLTQLHNAIALPPISANIPKPNPTHQSEVDDWLSTFTQRKDLRRLHDGTMCVALHINVVDLPLHCITHLIYVDTIFFDFNLSFLELRTQVKRWL